MSLLNQLKNLITLKTLFVFFFLFLTGLASLPFAHPAAAEELAVSAAISLKNALEDLGRQFEKSHPGVKVLFNFGSSGDLARQIEAGAPVDVFASAALKDMDDLNRQGLIRPGSKTDFAGNSLTLIVPNHSPIPVKSFQDLKDNRIQKIAIGNPKTVPAGRYAQEVLTRLQLWEVLKNKLILSENVRQVLDYVARGEVDAGLVYSTDARTRVNEIKTISTAPEGSHQPILYPIGIIRGTKNETLSAEFIALVLSRSGKDILQRYGFIILPEKTK
jgi:molybdate transport system substrate-binding protein